MSRIKLRNLLNITEQAPQAPMGDIGAPMGAPAVPPAGLNAGGLNSPPTDAEPQPTPNAAPEPEDPSEYDFTRDFRAFEDKKNKAEADAKKVLLDKMNERLLGKTIIANASRGYGQPKTDYTIEAVKKISVEFWYKDYVVIVTDDNDKKYFLTPGINIKIENKSTEPEAGKEKAPEPAAATPEQGAAPEESPNNAGSKQAPEPTGNPQANNVPTAPVPQPAAAATPQTDPSAIPQPDDEEEKKKKAAQLAEVYKDFNLFLLEFMNDKVKNKDGYVNFHSYISDVSEILTENRNVAKIKCKLVIPESHMVNNVDSRDIRLSAIDSTRKNTFYGRYSKGSVDITKNGRYYLLEYTKEIGWNE